MTTTDDEDLVFCVKMIDSFKKGQRNGICDQPSDDEHTDSDCDDVDGDQSNEFWLKAVL